MFIKKRLAKYGLFLFLFGVGIFIFLFSLIFRKDGTNVIISIDGNDIKTFNLSENTIYDIKENGCNRLIIKNGYAWIETADCPDELCVNSGKISKSGESIICLPHKLVVRIDNNISDKEGLDAIAE